MVLLLPLLLLSITISHPLLVTSLPSPAFTSILRSTMQEIENVVSVVSTFSGVVGGDDLRLSSAVSDCLYLLDFSTHELSLSLSPSPSPATAAGTGNRRSDLRSWLSGALTNQDTCREGLDATDSILGSLISAGLSTVTSLLSHGLREASVWGGGERDYGGYPAASDMGLLQLLLVKASGLVAADAVVAKDGSGNYTTVREAVEAAPDESGRRYVIHVRGGVYEENVEVKKHKWNIMLVGDGMGATVISASRSFADGWTTFRTATLAVSGKGFMARDLTIQNTAGPAKHQAVAFRSDSDLSVLYRCGLHGYQDTLYAHSLRQFYRECTISGTVDFIFGNAAAVFQRCTILARRPLPDQKNTLTAQGRKDPNQTTGFVIQFSNITLAPDFYSNNTTTSSSSNGTAGNKTATETYLGRPWKEYSRTVLMQSYIGGVVQPEGWLAWQEGFALSTLFYGEYGNYGPGSALDRRVTWPGFHAMNDSSEADQFTVTTFIDGNLWLPATGVKFTGGLQL